MVEYDYDRMQFYKVDGKPAIVQGMIAMKLVNDSFVPVIPSGVRAEGVEISEAEFDELVENAKRQGGPKHDL